MTMTDAAAPRGLKGVIVADTALGDVRGLEGFYHYRQYSAPELAATRTFEDVWYLLFEGDLPSRRAPRRVHGRASRRRAHLPAAVLDLLPAMAGAGTPPLAALRTALSHLAGGRSDAADLRRRSGDDPDRCDATVRGDAGARRRAVPGVDRRVDRSRRATTWARPRTTCT